MENKDKEDKGEDSKSGCLTNDSSKELVDVSCSCRSFPSFPGAGTDGSGPVGLPGETTEAVALIVEGPPEVTVGQLEPQIVPQPGTSNVSFPTKMKLLLQGAYRRVTPAPNEIDEEQPVASASRPIRPAASATGPMTGQDQVVYTLQVSNNNNFAGQNGFAPSAAMVMDACPAARSAGSVQSLEEVCRICHDIGNDEGFITPCLCKGTMALIHQKCLERWLGESGKTSCEICGYEYVTRRTPKYTGYRSIATWVRNPINPNDTKNFFFDVACFFILTPLATISAWLCIMGSQHYAIAAKERFKEGFNPANNRYRNIQDAANSTWTSIGLLTLTGTLLTAYYIWLFVAFRFHYQVFQDWRQRNYQVTVVPVNHELVGAQAQSDEQSEAAGRLMDQETIIVIDGAGSANASKVTRSLPFLKNQVNNNDNNDGLLQNV